MLEIQISRFTEFQHYKHRRPPWLRLYHRLLDDPDFRRLEPRPRCLLMDLWLLASEGEGGKFSAEPQDIAWRLRLQDASNMLADLRALAGVTDGEGRAKWLTCKGLPDNASTALATRPHDASMLLHQSREEKSRVEKSTPLTPQPAANGHAPEPWKAQAARLAARLSSERADLQAAGKLTLSYFNAAMGTHYRWGSKVEAKILARLAECRSASMLFFAIDGALKDDTIMGRRPDSPPDGYKRPTTVFRDAEQVDRFFALSRAKRDSIHPTLAEFLSADSAPA